MNFHWRTTETVLFLLLLVCMTGVILFTAVISPPKAPYGGPDEEMHRSVISFLADHGTWPKGDSPEMVRYLTGSSYATSSSIIYWWYAMIYTLSGSFRLGAVLLWLGLSAVLFTLYLKDRLTAWLGLGFCTPQAIYVFTYAGSDGGLILTALFFGTMIVRLFHYPVHAKTILLFFVSLGLIYTARMHLWIIGTVTASWAFIMMGKRWLRMPVKVLAISILVCVIIASWWPSTSYFANDGDVMAWKTMKEVKAIYGMPNPPKHILPLEDISPKLYMRHLIKSFYAIWGHGEVDVPYLSFFTIPLFGLFYMACAWQSRQRLWFYGALFLFNFLLILYYSVTYDYQPQGRYLFPWYFISIAMIMQHINIQGITSRRLKYFGIFMSLINVAGAILISRRLYELASLS